MNSVLVSFLFLDLPKSLLESMLQLKQFLYQLFLDLQFYNPSMKIFELKISNHHRPISFQFDLHFRQWLLELL